MEPGNIIDLAHERRRRGPRFNGRLMDILEVSRDLVCMCRAGAITAINGAGVRMMGATTAEELIGRRIIDFLIPEYGPVMDLFLAGKASEDKPVPIRLVGLDRTLRDVEMQVYRAREIAPDATIIVARDLPGGDRPADRLPAAAGGLSSLVEHAMNLVCHVVDGRIRYVNRAGVRMLGALDAEALTDLCIAAIFHADYAEVFTGDLLDSIVSERDGVPMRLRRLDGTMLDTLVVVTKLPSAAGLELMVEARDITAHNHAVMALRRSADTLEMRVAERTREVAEQRALAEELRSVAEESQRFSESLLDMIPGPVWYKDARGRLETCNRAFRELFGCDPVADPATADGICAAMPAEDVATDVELLAGGRDYAAFEAALDIGGGRRHALVVKCAYLDEEGRPVGVLGVITDITERKQMERELRRLATTDPLTGAANRRHFMGLAGSEADRAARYHHPLSVLMVDVDHFKRINDSHGHAAGDEALKVLVASCGSVLRDVDVLGRLGGEEFAVLLPETDADGAHEVAERLRQAVAAIRVPLADGGDLGFTCSVGFAARPPGGEETFEAMMKRADQALYRAKQAGRNRVEAG
ncbi:MAG: diguanylate cyclase [Solirubrobacterales bacterium]